MTHALVCQFNDFTRIGVWWTDIYIDYRPKFKNNSHNFIYFVNVQVVQFHRDAYKSKLKFKVEKLSEINH